VIETEAVSDNQRNFRGKSKIEDTSIPDLFDYIKTYAKQETVDPLRGVGRWVGYGAAGALCLGLGLVFVLLGLLRMVQNEWHRSATGSLSWLAYLITLVVAGALLAVTLLQIRKSTLNNEPK
jgi:hypothetical protein